MYSPYRDSDWSKVWDIDRGSIDEQAQAIARSLQHYIKPVKLMAQKAEAERVKREEEWQRERIKREEEWERYKENEKIRKREKSHTVSREELLTVITKWGEIKRIEHFFNCAEKEALQLSGTQKQFTLQRVARARELIGKTDALGYLLDWETPDEILATRKYL